MKQRNKLREWLIDHLEDVARTFPSVTPCDLKKAIIKIRSDNPLLFIYGSTITHNWPESRKPGTILYREYYQKLIDWGYDQHDLMAAVIWMQLNGRCGADVYTEVQVIDAVDPSRN